MGYTQAATIIGCTFSGSISATTNVGGIVGKAAASTSTAPTVIRYCRTIGDGTTADHIVGSSSTVGGIVGELTGTVQYCYTTANIYGSGIVGGIVGDMLYGSNQKAYVYDSYSTGRVYASATTGKAGGIAGKAGNSTSYYNEIDRCYATGVIYNKGQYTGGIAGQATASASSNNAYIRNSFALTPSITQVAKSTSSNYLNTVSDRGGSISNTRYLSTMSVYNDSSVRSGSAGSGSITLANAKLQSTYTSAGWAFNNNAWAMVPSQSDYPILSYWYEPPASVSIKSDFDFQGNGKFKALI